MKLIAGLGNPGSIYAHNRHNIGFVCLRHFAGIHHVKFDKKQGLARVGTGEIAGDKVMLARPQTYMNLSGESIVRLVAKLHIEPDDLLVIHDDLDLPLGKIRVRYGGSSGGHNGIDSIISQLDSRDFYRIRVGIGRPTSIEDKEAQIVAYVLDNFTPEEKRSITEVLPVVSHAIISLITEGLDAAMNKYN